MGFHPTKQKCIAVCASTNLSVKVSAAAVVFQTKYENNFQWFVKDNPYDLLYNDMGITFTSPISGLKPYSAHDSEQSKYD